MKTKIVSLWLACLLLFSCCGCSKVDPDSKNTDPLTEVAAVDGMDSEPTPSPKPVATATPKPTATPTPTPSLTPTPSMLPQDSYFEVHFIDVGQADSSLILCDGAAMLIDGGNSADSSLIYSYLKTRSLDHLDYIVCTHAHENHAGGLSGALNYATVDVALSPLTNEDRE